MSKKLIGLLLAVCLCIGLLPAVALADTTPNKVTFRILSWITISAEEGGPAAYLKNSEYQGYDAEGKEIGTGWTQVKATESDWNVKLEYPKDGSPILTIKDAKMVMVTDDGAMLYKKNVDSTTGDVTYKSQNSVSAIMTNSGAANCVDLNLVVEGENIIKVNNGIVRGNVGSSQHFKNITITGKDGGKISGFGGGIGISARESYTLTLDSVTLDLKTTNVGGGQPVPLRTEKGNMVIKNSTVKCGNNNNVAIGALYGGDILVENSTINVTSKLVSTAGPGCIYAQDGTVTIEGDKTVINATGKNNSCLSGAKGVIINGGELNLTSAYYALHAGEGADITFNGGTTKIIAQYACWVAPKLGDKIVTALVGANQDACEVYDGSNPNLAKQPWMVVSDKSNKDLGIEVTEPTVPTIPIVTVPSQSPSQAPSQTPTQTPTQAPTGGAATNPTESKPADDKAEGGSSTTLLIVAVALVVVGGAVVGVIIFKRKKA